MDSRVHGWFASRCSWDEHSIKKEQGVSCEATLKNMATLVPPTSRELLRKNLLANWPAFLPALIIVQAPNQSAQSELSSFFIGSSCCYFKSHHSFISSPFSGGFCLQVFFSTSCVPSAVMFCSLLLGGVSAWYQYLPFTPATFLAYKHQNVQSYKYHFISSCVCGQQYLLRISAQLILEEEIDTKDSFSKIMPYFLHNSTGVLWSRQQRKQTLPLGFDSRGIAVLKQMF